MAHKHDHGAEGGDARIIWAVAINVLLTAAQIVGGVLSGSLALIADSIHNLSDAVSLAIAFIARRIGRRPPNKRMTFGYGRAEIVAALINYTTLIVIGCYLLYEAVLRFMSPEPIEGWLVVWVAVIALVIDLATAFLTYALSKGSMNIRAAFLHNVSDALGSVAVIVAGGAVLIYGWTIVDPIVTLMIAGYILWQAFREIGGAIRILMMGVPPGLDLDEVLAELRSKDGVAGAYGLRVWSIDERTTGLEVHIVRQGGVGDSARLKKGIRATLSDRFGITESIIELDDAAELRELDCPAIGSIAAAGYLQTN